MSKSSAPTPLAVPNDLKAEIDEVSELLGFSKQDTMRLAMRIGLVDIRASKEIAQAIQAVAADKGAAFLSWSRERLAALQSGSSPPPPDAGGAAPPLSRKPDPDPEPPVAPRFGITQIIGPDPTPQQRASTMLNEDPPPDTGTLPEVGSKAWEEAKTAARKLAGLGSKKSDP